MLKFHSKNVSFVQSLNNKALIRRAKKEMFKSQIVMKCQKKNTQTVLKRVVKVKQRKVRVLDRSPVELESNTARAPSRNQTCRPSLFQMSVCFGKSAQIQKQQNV